MSRAKEDQLSDSSDEDIAENIDGWDDVEDDRVSETFVSLFDQKVFNDLESMLKYCKDEYDFDIWSLQQTYDLDFLGLVKLINYVRKSVTVGSKRPDLSSSSVFMDDVYLLPVMESDAVLYNLEDVLTQARPASKTREEELEEELTALKATFKAYKDDVTNYLGDNTDQLSISKGKNDIETLSKDRKDDDGYFQSYSYNSIHETMLKDRVRTDAYRDFIYEHKDVFKDKVVLDVGCGTGILSMFCARAGAKQVIAVDNSDIISTAREIIRTNKLDDKIQCIKGKIEEISLPVDKVDIIVSEWMGYALLFESMLDSVLWARDKYLAPETGLMVPSHANIRTGLLADSEVRETCLDFWQDVYGFDMTSMAGRTQDECIIKVSPPEDISGEPATLQAFDLHRVKVSDLDFKGSFNLKAGTGAQRFDGFSIWFDIFFATQRDVTPGLSMEQAKAENMVAFTTGPFGDATHWAQGLCLLDNATPIQPGSTVSGDMSFTKSHDDTRALTIAISAKVDSTVRTVEQTWHIK